MKSHLKTWLAGIAALSAVGVVQIVTAGEPDHFYASSERFGYTGKVSVYDTWADANSGRQARCSETVWPQRDGAIFVVKNAPEYWADSNLILTNWFANNGASPSDTNQGFFQLYDESADAWQNQKAFWSRDLETFTVSAKGRNATYGSPNPQDFARLWNACAPPGGGETTRGTFLRYEYELVATGLGGVEDPSGFITNTSNAAGYSGHFRGIFRNESTSSPASNGYYVFDLEFNNISWAVLNNCGYDGGAPQTPPCVGLPVLDDEFGGRRKSK
jgi:hypothetical protein